MPLKVLTLYTDEDGCVQHKDQEVRFRHGDSTLSHWSAGLSSAQKCRSYLFIEMKPGFKSSKQIADYGQLAVCLSGKLEICLNDKTTRTINPGDVMHLERETNSLHQLSVLGNEPAYLLMLLTNS